MLPLSQQLRTARKAKKLTQKQLGQGLGWTQAHLSEIENGKVDPRLSNVVQLGRLVDLELMLIPKALVPVVHALLTGKTDEPLWSTEDDESA